MKQFIILIVIVIVLAGAWYLGSPLFINEEINEEFPALDTLPTEEQMMEKMEGMTEDEKMEFKDDIMEQAANMPDTVMEETSPAEGVTAPNFPIELAQGEFVGADSFHQGSGNVTVYELETGKTFLRFEDFSVTNGPDLRVYLTEHPNPTSESEVKSGNYIEVAKLKGNKGNQNYELPNIDIDDYKTVLIYCKPFHVSFATASLN